MERVVDDVPCRRALRPQERLNLEPKKKDKKYRILNQIRYNVMILMILMVMTSNYLSYTYAYFTDSEQIKSNIFQADHINNHLLVTPGTIEVDSMSKDTYDQGANIDKSGKLYIDLGKVEMGSQKSFDNLLTLNNITNKPLIINWWYEGKIAEVIKSENNKFYLLPTKPTTKILERKIPSKKNPYHFDINLNTAAKGTYSGNLVIAVNGQFLALTIPIKVVVFTGDNKCDQSGNDLASTTTSDKQNLVNSKTNQIVPNISLTNSITPEVISADSYLVTPGVAN